MEELKARLGDLRAVVDVTELFDDMESLMSCCFEHELASE
jgi:hypothetical protein